VQFVYYSLASVGKRRPERQWLQSIRSLRAHNKSVQVHLIHYNAPSDLLLREAERQQVTIHRAGDYRDRLEEALPGHGRALTHYPHLHKLLSLQFLPVQSASQVLYLDCDTYFFRDVASLFSKYQKHHFYAREEPGSRRSPDGYEPSWSLNEETIAETCKKEGLNFIPPYNNGVFILNHDLQADLVRASREFLCYAWRLLLGISENEQLARQCEPALLREVKCVSTFALSIK
jgi:lipopolysaccharide biosynthesis glycosyltransferase